VYRVAFSTVSVLACGPAGRFLVRVLASGGPAGSLLLRVQKKQNTSFERPRRARRHKLGDAEIFGCTIA
jgi:hypothetical protein